MNNCCNQTLAEVEKIIDKWIERPSDTREAKHVDKVLICIKKEIKKLYSQGANSSGEYENGAIEAHTPKDSIKGDSSRFVNRKRCAPDIHTYRGGRPTGKDSAVKPTSNVEAKVSPPTTSAMDRQTENEGKAHPDYSPESTNKLSPMGENGASKDTLCKCGHEWTYHDTLTDNQCHLMDCKCMKWEPKKPQGCGQLFMVFDEMGTDLGMVRCGLKYGLCSKCKTETK